MDAFIRAGLTAPKKSSVSESCIRDVVESHDQRGWNYAWLTPYFGLLQWVDHREPAERITKQKRGPAAEWKTYGKWHWERHGAVIDHNPKTLVKEHVRYYVDADTRLIDLRFYFQLPNGFVYVTFPTRDFYRLERDWFARHGLCSHGHRQGNSSDEKASHVDDLMGAAYKLPGLTPYIDAQKIMQNMMPTPRLALRSLEESIVQMGIRVNDTRKKRRKLKR